MTVFRLKGFALLAALLTAALFFPVSGLADAPAREVIKIVCDDNYPPYIFRNDKGELQGILVDQWALWSKKTGVRAELTATDWGEAQKRMLAGEFDVIDTIFKNEKRLALYDFTPPYARIDVPIFFHSDLSGIRSADDVRGFVVAAKSGDNAIDVLKAKGVTNFIEFPNYESIIAAAAEGRVKVFTVDRPPALYFLNKRGIVSSFRETEPLYSGEFHRAVRKGDEAVLNLVMEGFKELSSSELQGIDRNWLGRPLVGNGIETGKVLFVLGVVGAFVLLLLTWLYLLRRTVDKRTKELQEATQIHLRDERLATELSLYYRAVFNAVNDAMIVESEATGLIVDANVRAEELYALTHDLLCSHAFSALETGDPSCSQSVLSAHFNAARAGIPQVFQWSAKGKGVLTSVEVSIRYARMADEGRFFILVRDSSERVVQEKALRESEERYRALYSYLTQGMALHEIILDGEGKPVDYRFLDVNPAFEKLLGAPASAIVGKTVKELLPEVEERWIEVYGKVALTGEPARFETYSQEISRYLEVVAYSPKRMQFAVVLNDLTDRKKLEEERHRLEQQMLHAQKLESLGVLAGGIAHDFNNLLMVILGNASLASNYIGDTAKGSHELRQISSAAERAAELARQMLAYSGKGRFVIEPVDLGKLVEEMGHMLGVSISKKAVLRFNLARELPPVEADATQLRQVLMNLVINASEAIGEKSGVIAISTGAMDCDTAYLKTTWVDDDLPEGFYVYFEVADTGHGIAKETLPKIFDPFFTTKFTGRGLGMAAVLGIVRGHKGAIKVYSEVGKGTTFKVLLPASGAHAEWAHGKSGSDGWKGSGLVLLVDDEETVRAVGGKMLETLGFDVVTAPDGREALKIYSEKKDEIAFVLLDLTMPHMDGEEAYREMRRLKPDVKAIISSGYNESEISQRFLGKGIMGIIQKPYTLNSLRETLMKLIEGVQVSH